jgi:hypothetical protein
MWRNLVACVAVCLLAACAAPPPAAPTAAPPAVIAPVGAATSAPLPSATVRPPGATDTPLPATATRTAPPPAPTVALPLQTVTAGTLPGIAGDALFLRDGDLVRWAYTTGTLETLAAADPRLGPVTLFSQSADGRRVALARVAPHATSIAVSYRLEWLDLNTRRVTALASGEALLAPGLIGFELSADGQWLAYIPWDLSPEARRGAGLSRPLAGGPAPAGTVYALRVDALDSPIELGHCAGARAAGAVAGCAGLRWSPDSRSVAWGDAYGLWVAVPGGSARQVVDTGGYFNTLEFAPLAWSSAGRYLLVARRYLDQDSRGSFIGGDPGVLDTETGTLAALVGPYGGRDPRGSVTWLDDGGLLVVSTDLPGTAGELVLQFWRLDPAQPRLLVGDGSWETGLSLQGAPQDVAVLGGDRVAFALRVSADGRDAGVYLYTAPLTGGLRIVRRIAGPPLAGEPGGEYHVTWAPDGSGAFVWESDYAGRTRMLIYAAMDDSVLYDLLAELGEGASSFVWTGTP